MKVRVACGLCAFVVTIATVAPGCLDPTEIQIDVQTDSCTALKSVEVYVGGASGDVASAPSAVATSCVSANDVGLVTLVPSAGIGDEVSVAVVGTLFGGTCKPDSSNNPSCIIARRSIRFSPHAKQQLTVRLDGACAGVMCPAGQTCEAGSCVTTCQEGCGEDAGPILDASPSVDTGKADAVSLCTAPGQLPTITAYWVWSFAPNMSPITDNANTSPQPRSTGTNVPVDTAWPCNAFLSVGSIAQKLAAGAPLDSAHLAFTMHYRASGTSANIFTLAGASKLTLHFDVNGSLVVSAITSQPSVGYVSDTGPSDDGIWHFAYVDVDTSTGMLTLARDGNKVGQTLLPNGYANGGTFSVGASADVDEVQVFAYGATNN